MYEIRIMFGNGEKARFAVVKDGKEKRFNELDSFERSVVIDRMPMVFDEMVKEHKALW